MKFSKLISHWGKECDDIRVPVEDLRHMVISTLYYALEGRSYATGLTSDILCALPKEVWDEQTGLIAIRALRRYLNNWDTMHDDLDYHAWYKLWCHLLPMCDAEFGLSTNSIITRKDKR